MGEVVSKMTYIYTLTDPRTGEIRYIGKANNPQTRFRVHTSPRRYQKDTYYVSRWICALAKAGFKPYLNVLEMVHMSVWREKEKEWITHYRRLGNKLTNIAPGGIGPLSGTPWTVKRRQEMSRRLKGRKLDTVWKQRISDAHKGKSSGPLSDAHKVAISRGNLGRCVTAATRQKISAANKGKRPADITIDAARRANIGNTYRTGKKFSEETKRKMSESHKGGTRLTYWKGKHHSEETKRKISKTLKERKKGNV